MIFGSTNEGKKKKTRHIPWISLASLEQLEEIEKKSNTKPQVIFKHSTTCGISRMVLNMFTNGYDLAEGQIDLYFLDLHKYRGVSNAISSKFGVMHQSPQLLVIKNEGSIFHTSHGAISEVDLKNYV